MMSPTSSQDSRSRLKTLSEALKERLSPEEWSAIFERGSERPSKKSPTERTP